MKIAVAQINTRIGDISYNREIIEKYINNAIDEDVDLVVFPEFALSGAPLMNIVDSADFIDKCYAALEDIAISSADTNVLIGMPTQSGDDFFSSVVYIERGKIKSFFSKAMIDNLLEKNFIKGVDSLDFNDESDEDIESEIPMNIIKVKGNDFLVIIGEDIDYIDEIDKKLKLSAIISLANPLYTSTSITEEYEVVSEAAAAFKTPIIRASLVGGNGASYVNFGGSAIFSRDGQIVQAAKLFQETMIMFDLNKVEAQKPITKKLLKRDINKDNYSALKLALVDFFAKQSFKKAVVGLSGGIDSAVVMAMAVKALGNENVTALLMPSEFSSKGSVDDSVKMAEMLGVKYHIVPLANCYNTVIESLKPIFGDLPFSVAEENIQARLRGVLLMAHSNKFGDILLNTSNKSEAAVGYGTLYGDTNGSLSILGDLYKDEVYNLAFYLNSIDGEMIPSEILDKAPSAELRPGQKDSDSLPEYVVLDSVLRMLIENKMSVLECVAEGYDVSVVSRIAKLVASASHKRFQLPPVVKMSNSTFGVDVVMPLAAKLV